MFSVSFWWIRTSFLVIFISLFCNLTGLWRDVLITAKFGATLVTDAYFVALLIPEALFQIFGSSLAVNFVPLYYEAEKAGRHRQLVANLFCLYLLLASLLFLLGLANTNRLITLFSSGFSGLAVETAAFLLRLFLANIFFITIANLCLAFLQAHNRFLISSAIALFYNFAVIAGTYYQGPALPLYALIGGTLVGYILLFVLQLPQAIALGLPAPAWPSTLFPELKKYLLLGLPVALLALLKKLTVALENYFATHQGVGSITSLNLGFQGFILLYSTFIISIMFIVYPALTKSIVRKNFQSTVLTLQKIINLLCIVLVPMAIYFCVQAVPIVDFVFRRGALTLKQSELIAIVFQGYTIGLFFYALRDLLLRYYFAEYNFRILIFNGVVDASLNYIYLLIFVPLIGLPGIAVAATLSVVSSCLLLLVLGGKQNPVLGNLKFFQPGATALASTGISLMVVLVLKPSLPLLWPGVDGLHRLIQLGTEFFIFAVAYSLLLFLLGKSRSLGLFTK
jgi:putative peptidoglycan lipid II flippase